MKSQYMTLFHNDDELPIWRRVFWKPAVRATHRHRIYGFPFWNRFLWFFWFWSCIIRCFIELNHIFDMLFHLAVSMIFFDASDFHLVNLIEYHRYHAVAQRYLAQPLWGSNRFSINHKQNLDAIIEINVDIWFCNNTFRNRDLADGFDHHLRSRQFGYLGFKHILRLVV